MSELKVEDVAYDSMVKEHVLITKEACRLSHAPEDLPTTHPEGRCHYRPSEGMAIRMVGLQVNGRPILAKIRRPLNPDYLQATDITPERFRDWLSNCSTEL